MNGRDSNQPHRRAAVATAALLALAMTAFGCSSAPPGPPVELGYVGSSTVAQFLREAEPIYGAARITYDTGPESEGGERAIVAGSTDLAGVANRPRSATLRAGVASTLVGRDAIAVIVNAKNPTTELTLEQLRDLFGGRVRNWAEVGGPDLPVEAFVVSEQSATHEVFRDSVLGGAPYVDCRAVDPDRDIIRRVAASPGGIGHISFSFLNGEPGIRPIAVDGEAPSVTNFHYPIARPLYLLWREGNPAVEALVNWTQTAQGQAAVMKRFVGIRVLGSVNTEPREATTGALVVYTETYPVYDGGIYYYPHRAYELMTRYGELIRRVPNHRGENDERPTRVELAPDTYLVRVETSTGERPEFFVTINAGATTELNVPDLLRRQRPR